MFLLVLVATAVLSVINYRLINNQLEERVIHIGDSSTMIFENLLVQRDIDTIQLQLDEHVALGAVTSARLVDVTGLDLRAGQIISDDLAFSVITPLFKEQNNTAIQIGQLQFQASLESVWDEVQFRAIATVLVAAAAILGTTFLVQLLLERTLLRPVLKISKALTNWSGDLTDLEIDLDRPHQPQGSDELDALVRSIHDMRDQILASQNDLADSQRRLLRAAQIAGVGYSSFDLETGRYVTCDENYASMINKTIPQMLKLRTHEDIVQTLMHPDDVAEALAIGKQIRRGTVTQGLFRIAITPGDYRYIRQIFEPGPKIPGHRQLVHCVAQDVTEINTLQSRLLQAQKVEAIGQLTGSVAHDFNNILAIISGNLELLKQNSPPTNDAEYIATALRAVDCGSKLTGQLLAFARKQPLMPRVFDVAARIQDAAVLLTSSVGKGIKIDIQTDENLWNAKADPAQLEAALLNLVVNARDAMPDGGNITITTSNIYLDRAYANQHGDLSPGQYISIAVKDTGCGMAPETLDRVLEPYFTTKDPGRGTGLGLSMVFGFAKQSGGHLKVCSKVGEGTRVKLFLPRARAEAEPKTTQDHNDRSAELNDLHVLLINDDIDLLKTYSAQLEKHGCAVHSAQDARAVQALVPGLSSLDVVLCDRVLSGKTDAARITKVLRDHHPDCAMIYMSDFDETADDDPGSTIDQSFLLEKPFTLSELIQAFKKATAKSTAGSAPDNRYRKNPALEHSANQ